MNLNEALEMAMHRNRAMQKGLTELPPISVAGHGSAFVVAPRYEFQLLLENHELVREILVALVRHLNAGETRL